VVGEREYEASEYYHGWGLKYDVYWVVIGAMAHAGSGGATSISLMRPRKARPLSQTTVRFVRQILPHLRRAVQIHSTMESLRATVGSAIEAMHHLEAAMVAINGAGRAVLVSRAAEQIFRQQNGLQLCNGQLACSAPEQDRQLRDLLQGSCGTGAGRGTHTGGMMLVGRDEHSPLHVSVVPFLSSSMLTEVAPCALVFIRSTDRAPASRAHVLSALYGLTPAECRLSDLLLQRPDLKTAGEQLHVTRETARFMLKAILRKTGTHRQAELVRFLLALPGAPL
jgi:DNA-binding CsgD family transcriptional regulator